jgi:hypothetical protein
MNWRGTPERTEPRSPLGRTERMGTMVGGLRLALVLAIVAAIALVVIVVPARAAAATTTAWAVSR